MKTKLLFSALLSIVSIATTTAQGRTSITVANNELSDHLDLKAVASVFGASQNIQDFEQRLNDPRRQLSNLDLNYDNQVDYLRVIESVENRTHVVVIQAVLGRNLFQDVATIDIETDRYNTLSIQVVGDVFLYGPNYIYEPVYYQTPAIYATFYSRNYRPYCSTWTWNYYPSYYASWRPFPVYRYRDNIISCIDNHNTYYYVSYRKSNRAPSICAPYRQNYYEKRYPNYSFSNRNKYVTNRYELERRGGNRGNKEGNGVNHYLNTRGESERRETVYQNPAIYPNRTSNTRANRNEYNSHSVNNESRDTYSNRRVIESQSDVNRGESNWSEINTKRSQGQGARDKMRESRSASSNENGSDEMSRKHSQSVNPADGNRISRVGNRRI